MKRLPAYTILGLLFLLCAVAVVLLRTGPDRPALASVSDPLEEPTPVMERSGKIVEASPMKDTKTGRRVIIPAGDQPPPVRPESIMIETKFVEVGSSTEELGFDWIVTQPNGEPGLVGVLE